MEPQRSAPRGEENSEEPDQSSARERPSQKPLALLAPHSFYLRCSPSQGRDPQEGSLTPSHPTSLFLSSLHRSLVPGMNLRQAGHLPTVRGRGGRGAVIPVLQAWFLMF